jgi:hypothetical protein
MVVISFMHNMVTETSLMNQQRIISSPPRAERRANIGLTCEAELARNLHEDFSRLRDKPPSQVEAFVG